MATKGRLTNIEDPTLAFIGSGTGKAEEKSSVVKKPVKNTTSKPKTKVIDDQVEVEGKKAPELLKRPERERLTKRFMILLPESLYIRLFNASVESEKSLNKYILDVLKDHADNNAL